MPSDRNTSNGQHMETEGLQWNIKHHNFYCEGFQGPPPWRYPKAGCGLEHVGLGDLEHWGWFWLKTACLLLCVLFVLGFVPILIFSNLCMPWWPLIYIFKQANKQLFQITYVNSPVLWWAQHFPPYTVCMSILRKTFQVSLWSSKFASKSYLFFA